jgi:hypothetical protein
MHHELRIIEARVALHQHMPGAGGLVADEHRLIRGAAFGVLVRVLQIHRRIVHQVQVGIAVRTGEGHTEVHRARRHLEAEQPLGIGLTRELAHDLTRLQGDLGGALRVRLELQARDVSIRVHADVPDSCGRIAQVQQLFVVGIGIGDAVMLLERGQRAAPHVEVRIATAEVARNGQLAHPRRYLECIVAPLPLRHAHTTHRHEVREHRGT